MTTKPGAPLDAEQMKIFSDKARRQLRARMRSIRGALPKAAVKARSDQIVERLLALPCLERAAHVGSFWPLEHNSEVDLRELDAALAARGTARYYPFMDPRSDGQGPLSFTTGFRRIESTASLAERGRGFAEPPPDGAPAARGDLDVILVPALVATPDGARLGYGAGFYDATLPDFRPPALAIIVAFSFQLVGELPLFEHDVCCDGVVTDAEVFDPRALLGAPR
jgi:5-formyltetrahydrofolate cyclo-ligase